MSLECDWSEEKKRQIRLYNALMYDDCPTIVETKWDWKHKVSYEYHRKNNNWLKMHGFPMHRRGNQK